MGLTEDTELAVRHAVVSLVNYQDVVRIVEALAYVTSLGLPRRGTPGIIRDLVDEGVLKLDKNFRLVKGPKFQ